MTNCKKCDSNNIVKNGIVRKKQRYRCNNCGLNFIHGDDRTNEEVTALKALTALLTSLGADSPRKLGRLIGRDASIVCRWQCEIDLDLGVPNEVIAETKTMDWWIDEQEIPESQPIFDETKPLHVSAGKLPSGLSVMIIVQNPNDIKK